MSNVKVKFSLSVVMLLVLVMALSSVFAVDRIFNLSATYNGKALTNGDTVTVSEDTRKIEITVEPKFVDDSLKIGYIWDSEAIEIAATGKKTATVTIPNFAEGSKHKLKLEAIINDDADNYIGNSNVIVVDFQVPNKNTTIDVDLVVNGKAMDVNTPVEVKAKDTMVVKGTSNMTVDMVAYVWDKGALQTGKGASKTITVPEYAEGSVHTLGIQAVTVEDVYSEPKTFTVKIAKSSTTPVDPEPGKETKVDVVAKLDGKELVPNKEYEVSADDKIVATGSTNNDKKVAIVAYRWDDEALVKVNGNKAEIAIPDNFEAGTSHKLAVQACSEDDKYSEGKYYTITLVTKAPESDELEVEDWMKENNDLETLAVSLRNDSEDDKGNKNFYMLDEEVIYYVDYKNGGSDIKKEVKLVLELPLDFKVIDSYGGTVDKSKKTITWTFPNGLEEDQAGTKIVRIAYTSLDSKNKKYKIVYPIARIYKQTKVADESAVINYIYKDEDTVMNDEHYPYMFGDRNAPTFRPDDSITRAEGALVLTRIFGINTSGVAITSVYPDLDETYLEAQKAIIAATKLGIINGYPDGSYRPNNKMTRAEFMKILASYIEVNAEEEDIDGLEVKDVENSIKLYKNPTSMYVMGNTTSTTSSHWAINWVTLLVRLNMTPVSSSNKNLRLDDEITRAEVAQLVNFYLLRAPADSGKSKFEDVAKNHKLFKDIIEATRDAHSYSITADGYEVAEKED